MHSCDTIDVARTATRKPSGCTAGRCHATAPYMHDGRFASLPEVVEHYNSGVQAHPNLDPVLRQDNNQVSRLNLSATEKQALVDFLGTLTDTSMVNDIRFSDPFKASLAASALSAIISLLLGE